MSKQIRTIDWKKLWDDFDVWYTDDELKRKIQCKTCSHTNYSQPEWEDQQAKIKQLIDAQVRKIV